MATKNSNSIAVAAAFLSCLQLIAQHNFTAYFKKTKTLEKMHSSSLCLFSTQHTTNAIAKVINFMMNSKMFKPIVATYMVMDLGK